MTSARASTGSRPILPALVALLLAPASAAADENHYQNYLIGERALGLGGAFVAISDDAAGAYYNPAGLAEADHSSLSLSAAVYGLASQSDQVHGTTFEGGSRCFVSYPTTTAWLQRVRRGRADGSGRVLLSLSLLTPQSNATRRRYGYRRPVPSATGQSVSADVYSVQIAEDDTLWVGLAAAWKVHRRISIGGTFFTTVRSGLYQIYANELYRSFDPMTGSETDRFAYADRIDLRISHLAILGLLGVVVPVGERLRLGASFRTPSLALRGTAHLNRIHTPTTGGRFDVVTEEYEHAGFRDRQPWKATIGAAVLAPRRYGVALDVAVFGPVGEYATLEHPDEPTLSTAVRMKKRPVVQIGAGGELYLGRGSVPLRAGIFTNLSSLARMEDCDATGLCVEHQNLFTDGIDLYGFSGSLGYEVDRATLTLGVSYSFGARTTPLQAGSIESRRSYLFLSLGGSFRF